LSSAATITDSPAGIDDSPSRQSAAPQSINADRVTIIKPRRGWQLINARELWAYRELLGFLVWRDVKVRYKQTLLGAAWAVLQPLLMMIVFTIFFARMARVNSGGLPYPLFAFAGLLPWTFFSTSISQAGNSVVGSEKMITKIYFPRLSIPFASVGAALVDFAIAFGMLLILMAWYRVVPTMAILVAPLTVALIALTAMGVGTLLAALNVAYRDFRYVIPFLVQLWMFATPTVYMQPAEYAAPMPAVAAVDNPEAGVPATGNLSPSSRRDEGALPNYIQLMLNLNPLVGLVAFFRASVLGGPLPWMPLLWSTIGAITMFVVGCMYFRHVEDSFADII
jgi:lipopolysaccharide transport system permease protein